MRVARVASDGHSPRASSVAVAHALIETTVGRPHRRDAAHAPGLRGVAVLTGACLVVLLALSGAALWLPGSDLVEALLEGVA